MSINDDAMADLFKLPEPDYIHASKLDDPIGSGRSWKFPAMRKMLHRAEAAEKQRDELLAALEAVLPWVVIQEVACNGLKCREAVCQSCNSDSEEAAEQACAAYSIAQKVIANAKGA